MLIEAVWGADPLERYGGFHGLPYDISSHFPSSLAANGSVQWAAVSLGSASKCSVETGFTFEAIDWQTLQLTYGWPALQFQAWARSTFNVPVSGGGRYSIHVQGVMEYWIDSEHYFGGDLYSFDRAPLVRYLEPGLHTVEVRLIRDVRSMGATSLPSVPLNLRLEPTNAIVTADQDHFILPDIVGDRLTSTAASIPLINHGPDVVRNINVMSLNDCIYIASVDVVRIVPGQTRLMSFEMRLRQNASCESVTLAISYDVARLETQTQICMAQNVIHVRASLKRRRIEDSQKITFRGPGGVVSYAILRPPSSETLNEATDSTKLPVLLALHGAGLDADSQASRHSLDAARDLPVWTLFPTGGTLWSGDDWHHWGWADVESAIKAIPTWIQTLRWIGPDVDIERWLVVGHSNGGQGVWHALSNRPDNVIAAAPTSGYSSIQAYVPYLWWREVEPFRESMIQATLSQYRHELLVPTNAHDIPIAIQHGAADDNVPPFHSRRMNQLLAESGRPARIKELTGVGHWFDGVLTTNFLMEFYREELRNAVKGQPLVGNFSITVANPRVTGPKNGLRVIKITNAGQLGVVTAAVSEKTISLHLFNVESVSLDLRNYDKYQVCVGEQSRKCSMIECDTDAAFVVITKPRGDSCLRVECTHVVEAQALGGIDAILQTEGKFTIANCNEATHKVCLQVARNLMQYFGADSEIVTQAVSTEGNVITIGVGADLPKSRPGEFPLEVKQDNSISVRRGDEVVEHYVPGEDGLAVIFLRPWDGGKLEMVLWGSDVTSLDVAARLAPSVTGGGQPDFVVTSRKAGWKGVGGVRALGFFNPDWSVSPVSFFS